MAIDGGSVVFTFNGDTTPFTQSLTQLQKGLDKSATAAEGAAKTLKSKLAPAADKVAAATKKSRQGIKDFADTAGDADSSLMGVAGALGLVSPELESLARTAGDGLAAVEGISKAAFFSNPIFIALGVAAGAAALAYKELAEEEEKATKATKELRDAQVAMFSVFMSASSKITEQKEEIEALRLGMSRLDWEDQKKAQAAFAQDIGNAEKELGKLYKKMREIPDTDPDGGEEYRRLKEEAKKAGDAIAALKVQRDEYEQGLKVIRDLTQEEEEATKGSTSAKKEQIPVIKQLVDLEDALDKARAGATGKLVLGMDEQIEAVAALMETEKDNQEVQTQGLELIEQIVAFTREQIEANKALEESKALEKVAADLQKIADLESAVVNARLTGVEAIDQWEQEQLSALDALQMGYEEESKAFKDAEAAKTAIATEASKRRKDLTAEEIEAQRDLTKETLSALEGLASASGEAISFLMERQLEETGKVSLSLYRLSQVAALAEVAFKTSVGYMEAGVVSVANPVLGAIMYAGVSVAAATSTASILAAPPPTLHSGGMVEGTAPDEVTLVKGEGVVNTLGMGALGEDGLSQLNRGAGANTVIVQQFKHKVLDVVIADSLNRNSPLRRAVRGDRPRGIVPRNGV